MELDLETLFTDIPKWIAIVWCIATKFGDGVKLCRATSFPVGLRDRRLQIPVGHSTVRGKDALAARASRSSTKTSSMSELHEAVA